jgi:hypothetical protein
LVSNYIALNNFSADFKKEFTPASIGVPVHRDRVTVELRTSRPYNIPSQAEELIMIELKKLHETYRVNGYGEAGNEIRNSRNICSAERN